MKGGAFAFAVVGIVGLIVALVATSDREVDMVQVAALGGWAILLCTLLLSPDIGFLRAIRDLLIWAVVLLGLSVLYLYRFELQDVGARLSGGLVPGSPVASMVDGRPAVTLTRGADGHFDASALVDGAPVRFLVDTGATGIVLSDRDARAVGLDVDALRFDVRTQTANGEGRSARARVGSITLGPIERRDVRVLVAEPGRLGRSLLGQEFLSSLNGYERRGDRLTLWD